MKILEENLKNGEITVRVENLNDLWTLYNLISEKDIAAAKTNRRVVLKEGTKGERKSMYLTISVENASFHEFSSRLRIKGTILEGPEDFVSYGTYHTLNIGIGHNLTIKKHTWLNSELSRLKASSKLENNFIILFVAVETGLATIDIITNYSHSRITSIKTNIPGKRYEQKERNKAYNEFFENIIQVVEENLKETEVDLIVLCGPGNTRIHLLKFIKEKASFDYISKIKSLHASSGTESAILEAIKSEELATIKNQVKLLKESEKIEEIFNLLSKDTDLISIGMEEIAVAAERGAIKDLFLVDTLIRGTSKEHKLKIEDIITNVENCGGEINILSSETPTGQQINSLGSLVGILRYKL